MTIDTAPTVGRLDDPQKAARLRETAGHMREQAAGKREAAEQALQDGRKEADRILAEAQAAARALTTEAAGIDRDADKVEEHAGYVDHAHAAGQHAFAAAQRFDDLIAESARLGDELDSLNERVSELQKSVSSLTAGIEAAVAAEDVEEVVALRSRLQATEEVAAEVGRRRTVVAARLAAIGPDGHERAQARTAVSAARTQYERALDRVDPDRPRRRTLERTAAMAEQLQAAGGAAEDAWRSAALMALLAEDPEWGAALRQADVPTGPASPATSVSSNGRAMMVRKP